MNSFLLRVVQAVGSPFSSQNLEHVPQTEPQWLNCPDAADMLRSIFPPRTDRKLRLFNSAACRLYLPQPADWADRLEVADRFADGRATRREVQEAARPLPPEQAGAIGPNPHRVLAYLFGDNPRKAALELVEYWAGRAGFGVRQRLGDDATPSLVRHAEQEVRQGLTAVLHELVGQPLFPVEIDLAWRTQTVCGLADAIYAQNAFEQLPVLADALEEAGCDAAEIIDHCRGPGRHFRGCWVVDRILGRV